MSLTIMPGDYTNSVKISSSTLDFHKPKKLPDLVGQNLRLLVGKVALYPGAHRQEREGERGVALCSLIECLEQPSVESCLWHAPPTSKSALHASLGDEEGGSQSFSNRERHQLSK